jgi:putative hydrolase
MSGHAFCTVSECIATAQSKGLSLIAITDHGPAMEHSAHEGYFEMSERIPKRFGSLGVLFGCEVNIINTKGDIDLSESTISGLDIVLAGLHEKTPYAGDSEADNTNALINAMEKNPGINIISHPYRAEFPVKMEEVVCASMEYDVLLEINAFLLLRALSKPNCPKGKTVIENTARIVDMLQSRGIGFVISSDAHHSSEIGIGDVTLEILSKSLGISYEYVLNDKTDLLCRYIPHLSKKGSV